MISKFSGKTVVVSLLLCSLILSISSCKLVQKIDSLNGILEPPPPDSEIGELLAAEKEYFDGNYEQSRSIYAAVRDNSEKPAHKNSALYGLACIAVITASDGDDLKEGLALMEQWQEPGTEEVGYEENPGMMVRALNSRSDLFECRPEIRYVTTKKEGELIQKHKEEISELKATIEKLEHQISELEAIDQEIQEKRKPL